MEDKRFALSSGRSGIYGKSHFLRPVFVGRERKYSLRSLPFPGSTLLLKVVVFEEDIMRV